MKLNEVVPWGRSFDEYKKMFSLSEDDFKKRILGCGDGPASFNAELTSKGGDVVSVDPVYEFSKEEIKERIGQVYDEIMDQLEKNKGNYVWKDIKSVEELGRVRMDSMNTFIADYNLGKRQGRYQSGALPKLNFENNSFDIALCSHFLFLYSSFIEFEGHLEAINEMCRVSKEVRIYPLVSLDGQISCHLKPILQKLETSGLSGKLVPVEYRFQKNATHMLVIYNS